MSYKRNLLPKMAVERMNENPEAVLIDVRTRAEHKYVGFPDNSILIPWFDEPDLESDPDTFYESVLDALSVIVMTRWIQNLFLFVGVDSGLMRH